jgi:hypothetical protein
MGPDLKCIQEWVGRFKTAANFTFPDADGSFDSADNSTP